MRTIAGVVIPVGVTLISAGLIYAQFGRGGGDWTTSGNDAQRSSWVRSDAKISLDSLEKPGFTMIWKVKVSQDQKTSPLTDAVLLDRYIGYRGFRSLGFMGGISNQVFAVDTDLSRIEWRKQLPGGSTSSCADTLVTQVARPGSLEIEAAGAAPAGRGRGGFARGTVGEPNQGANIGDVPRRNFVPRPAPAGRGARAGQAGGRSAVPNMFRRGPSYVYALTGDGMLHQMYVSSGDEPEPAFKFLPANASASGLIVVDGVAYAVTTKGCGGAPEGVWALDLESKKVASWNASVAGTAGMAFAPDGTLYVATGPSGDHASSIVALDPKTLQPKDWYSAGSGFTSSPVIFEYKDKLLAAATTRDGRLQLVDTKSLGGSDHKTPIARTAVYSDAENFAPGALASWEDPQHTRWILAPSGGPLASAASFNTSNGRITNGAIVAWKVTDQKGAPSLEPGWVSRDMVSPMPPMIVNGVVFALAAGKPSTPAVLYALNPSNGKELYNSGGSIGSFVRGGGLSEGGTQLYVGAADGTLYAFGFPIEH